MHNNSALWKIAFASKILRSAETHYSKIEREVLCRLHDLEKFHHYYFAHEVCIIEDHKLLVVNIKKDIASLSHELQRILQQIYQYKVRILYKPEPPLFTADWQSKHNHTAGKDKEIPGMHISINAIAACTDI